MHDEESVIETVLADLDVRLVESARLGVDYNAVCHSPSRTIIVRWGLDAVTKRCAIAHELGHVHHGHDCSTPRYERDADEWAALQLPDEDRVSQVASESDHSPAAMAEELGVTPQLLGIWLKMYEAGRVPCTWDCLR